MLLRFTCAAGSCCYGNSYTEENYPVINACLFTPLLVPETFIPMLKGNFIMKVWVCCWEKRYSEA